MYYVPDEVWDVFLATEVIPKYQNNVFLTVEDAVVAANVLPNESDTPTPDKVGT